MYVQQKLEDATQFGFEDVFYGDQDLIPRNPAAAIEPVSVAREISGVATGGMVKVNLSFYLFVYHTTIQSPQKTRQECDAQAELVQRLLHDDLTMSGRVIHGFCTNCESGVAQRAGAMFRAHRITWEGISKERLTP